VSSEARAEVREPERQRPRDRAAALWSATSRYAVVLLLLIGIFIFFSLTQPDFLSKANIENLLTGSSILFVVSIGMTFVVLTGGIDLSVGSLLALSGIILSELFNDLGVPGVLAVLLTCLAAAVIGGAVNGVLIGRLGLSFFVVTLGTLSIYRGVVNIWSNTETTYISSSFVDSIAFGELFGIAYPIWIMLATYLVALVVLHWTYFGRDVYAVGGNITAARLSGINVARTLIMVYAIAGLCAGIGGVIQAGRLGAASPLVGQTTPLDAAAAVLLGGTSFLGGVGGVTGTAVGVIFIGTLQNGLSIAGVSSFWQQVVTGVILIVAIAIDRLQQTPGGRWRGLRGFGHGPTSSSEPTLEEGKPS
jgi:ribose/xylose/arabinose/galactoside ABC-type transport system permease subunit